MTDASSPLPYADALIVALALTLAAWVRPWRAAPREGPPWPWIALWLSMPLSWGLDRWLAMPLAVPLSGAPLLVLFAGWPLAVLAMPLAAIALLVAHLPLAETLHRVAWLGIVPASLTLGLGAAVRRWLPHHPLVYILGRGYFGTFLAVMAADAASLLLHGGPPGIAMDGSMIARVLAAFSEAFLTGMITAIAVAFRPHWLATWSDRVYLPPPPR